MDAKSAVNRAFELAVHAVSPPAVKLDTQYSFGFSRPSGDFRFGVDNKAFGCPGAGGSFGMGDPSAELGFAYLTNKMGFRLFDDPREKAVRHACYASLAAMGVRPLAA